MHQSSYEKMEAFRRKYLYGRESEPLVIYDLGSQDVNGSYRPIFSEPAWCYKGLDMSEGKNVDIVLRTPYVWREVRSRSADVIISGQAFEHIQYFWITMLEMARTLKPGGLCCILAPSSGPEHRYPVDCWRFYPDGMRSLANFVKFEVLESTTSWAEHPDPGSTIWHDSMLICCKPNNDRLKNAKINFKRALQHKALTFRLNQPPANI